MQTWKPVVLVAAIAMTGMTFARAGEAATTAVASAPAASCPRALLVGPQYPAALVREGITGTVRLRYQRDACGRVTQAEVLDGPHPLLGEAALVALRKTVYGPLQGAAVAPADGWYSTTMRFAQPASTPRQMGWPDTHMRARYEVETAADAPDIAGVRKLVAASGRSGPPPYTRMKGRFYATGTPGAPEFWLLVLGEEGQYHLAARYRPVVVDGAAVVRLLVVCEDAADVCAQDRARLLEGASFARAE